MEHLKQALTAHGIPRSAIDQLAAFESRDGLSVLDEAAFGQLQEYFRDFPVHQLLVPLLTDGNSRQLAAKNALREITASCYF